jgi:hypothetical protein
MSAYIEKYQNKILQLSVCSTIFAFASYLMYAGAYKALCTSFLYTPAFSTCTNHYLNLASLGLFIACFVALCSSLSLLLGVQHLRRFYKKSLLFYSIQLPIIIVPAILYPMCLGWLGCFSLLPVAVLIEIILLVFYSLAISWSLLVPKRKVLFIMSAVVVLFVCCGLVASFAVSLGDREQNLLDSASYDPTACSRMGSQTARDHCYFVNGLSCGKIESPAAKSECEDYIIRNAAVDNLDSAACDKINLPDQRYICHKLIKEQLSN